MHSFEKNKKEIAELDAEITLKSISLSNLQQEIFSLVTTFGQINQELVNVYNKRSRLLNRLLTSKDLSLQTYDLSLPKGELIAGDYPFLIEGIEKLHLKSMAYNALIRADITLIGDLVSCTEEDLLRIRCFAYVSLKNVKNALARHGLSLGMKLDHWPPIVKLT